MPEEVAAVIAGALNAYFEVVGMKGANGTTLHIEHSNGSTYELTIRKADGKTPSQVITGLREEVEELNNIFDLQYKRLAEWTREWRAESPKERALTHPDFLKLVEWKVAKEGAANREEIEGMRCVGNALVYHGSKMALSLTKAYLGNEDTADKEQMIADFNGVRGSWRKYEKGEKGEK